MTEYVRQEVIDKVNTFIPDKYPEVYNLKEVYSFNPHNWFSHANFFNQLLASNTIKLAVEVGTWMGGSARHIANLLPEDSLLLCVDTWQGSEEHQPGSPFHVIDLDKLFNQFLSNTISTGLQDRIIPVRLASLEAAKYCQENGLKFDFIYIDAAHDYENVKADLNAWYPLLNVGGIFIGDDMHHPPIVQAVTEFSTEKELKLTVAGSCWRLA